MRKKSKIIVLLCVGIFISKFLSSQDRSLRLCLVEIGENCVEVVRPAAISDQLADGLVAFTLDEQFVALWLREVLTSSLLSVIHVKEDLRDTALDHDRKLIEGAHGEGSSHDQAQVYLYPDLGGSL